MNSFVCGLVHRRKIRIGKAPNHTKQNVTYYRAEQYEYSTKTYYPITGPSTHKNIIVKYLIDKLLREY